MICFHFTIFVVLTTTKPLADLRRVRLWFAFILLSLSYWQQRHQSDSMGWFCCDLLSFYYLCRTDNNQAARGSSRDAVVICFHFTIFVVLTTTSRPLSSCSRMLWFAFILLSLSYWQQLCRSVCPGNLGCDLLSFYYLCRTDNNKKEITKTWPNVVICFHFTIFVVLTTTENFAIGVAVGLWFAFILLSLSYWQQLSIHAEGTELRCDLLSFYYLCRTDNNRMASCNFRLSVVICFHFTIFVVLTTTALRAGFPRRGCDLLSFYYLCRTDNNPRLLIRGHR